MNWIVTNKDTLNIQTVVHLGDHVQDESTSTEWDEADGFIGILDTDGTIPYLLGLGNHEYPGGAVGAGERDATEWNTYFPQSRYTGQSWWSGGFYEASHSENAYLLLTIESIDYIFITLENNPRQDVIDWANTTLTTYSTRRAVVSTHDYLAADGTHKTTDSMDEVDAHTGAQIWDELIKLHDNIILVQCGHVHGWNMRSDLSSSEGATIWQVLSNYQDLRNGGDGYLRIMVVRSGGTIEMYTYSTSYELFFNSSGNQFGYTL